MNQEQAIPFKLPEELEEEDEEQELLLLRESASRLHLDNNVFLPPPCTVCNHTNGVVSSASHKRPPTPTHEPDSKKPNNRYHGFSKIPLPTSTTTATNKTRPVLRRCISDPLHGVVEPPQSPPLNSESPTSAVRTSAANLPPRPQVLKRCFSDPVSSPVKSLSRSSSSCGSDDVKSLRMMRDLMREMTRVCDQNLHDEEINTTNINSIDDADADENNNNATVENCEEECVEAVSVERAGDCLIIHFKCPCGKGYQILLSGRHCYYKLL